MKKSTLDSYCIENVELWTAEGVRTDARLFVKDGRLESMNTAVPDHVQVIDGQGKVLMPAGVDAQAHLRVPGQAQKETAETGLMAALKGGYSALLTMPNTKPVIDSVSVLKAAQDEVRSAESNFGVHVLWSAAITRNLNSDDVLEFDELVRAGVRAFTNDGLGVDNDAVMDKAFARLEKLGVPLLQHAEFSGHGGVLAPGPVQRQLGVKPYSDDPEWKMVERDLRVLEKHPGARYHVLHVSSRKTLDIVRSGKKRGLQVTAEVSPHHLYFNTDTMRADNASFKMNPPIRSREDQDALWEGLKDGTIDFVATDHAPHEELMKKGALDKAAFGTLGLETTLPVLIAGLKERGLTPKRLVEVFATRPAEFLRLPMGFGGFVVGAPFHATWVDVKAPPVVYTENNFSSLSKNSCFIGAALPGRILGAFHEQRCFHFN